MKKKFCAALTAICMLALCAILPQAALAAQPLSVPVREQPVAAGYSDFYAIRADGTLVMWGIPEFTAGGMEEVPFAQARELLPNAAAVYTSGRGATFAVDKEGGLYGINMGTTRFEDVLQRVKGDPDDPMEPVKLGDGVAMVSVGQFHTLVLRQSGELWVQGTRTFGAPWLEREGACYEKVMDNVVDMCVYNYGGFAVTAGHELWGWGMDENTVRPKKLLDNVTGVSWNLLARPSADGETTQGWRWQYDPLGGKAQVAQTAALDGVVRVSSGIAVQRGGGLCYYAPLGGPAVEAGGFQGEYRQVMDKVEYAARGEQVTLVVRYGGTLWSLTEGEDGTLEETRLGSGFYGGTPGEKSGLDNFTAVNRYRDGQFTDVKPGDWFADNVKGAYELGLMTGNSPTTFAPEDTITVAEAVTVAVRVRGTYYGEKNSFGAADPWYQPYVDYAIANGMINAAPKDCDRPATRAELASLLAAALPPEAMEAVNREIKFTDVTEQHSAYSQVMELARAGVMGGKGDGVFDPDAPVLRCEAAAMLSRAAQPALRLVGDK